MTKRFHILGPSGVENVIVASLEYMQENYPAENYEEVPDVQAPTLEDPRIWQIYPGPFKDRLGMDGLAIACSTHDACVAVKEMLNGRLYVNLKDPKLSMLLDILIANNQPTANPLFPGSGPLTTAKKTTILTTSTTEEERFVKGLKV